MQNPGLLFSYIFTLIFCYSFIFISFYCYHYCLLSISASPLCVFLFLAPFRTKWAAPPTVQSAKLHNSTSTLSSWAQWLVNTFISHRAVSHPCKWLLGCNHKRKYSRFLWMIAGLDFRARVHLFFLFFFLFNVAQRWRKCDWIWMEIHI